MKRTNEEFKAEVFRRREEYYKKRKMRISMITAACVPFMVCFAMFAVMILPAMMPANSGDMYAPENKTENWEYADHQTVGANTIVTSFSDKLFLKYAESVCFSEGGKTSVGLDEAAETAMISFMLEIVSENEGGINEISKYCAVGEPLYELRFSSATGEARAYRVYRNCIVCGENIYLITENELAIIEDILGID